MKVLKKTGTIVISVLLWLVILVAALYAFTTIATRDNQNVSSLLGYTPLVVKSDSMAPTFSAGDLIFIKKCDTSTLKEGDIICFHTIIDNEYALNTHRIQKIDTVGKVMDFLSSSMGFLIVIVLPMLLFFIYQVYNLIMIAIRLKKAVAVETARETAIAQEEAAQKAAAQRPEPSEAQNEAEAAKAALEEARKMREEAEAIRAKAEKELADARKQQGQSDSGDDQTKEEGTES